MSIIGNAIPVNVYPGDLTVRGDIEIEGSLSVTGTTDLSGSTTIRGDLSVFGNHYDYGETYIVDPITVVNYLSGAPVSGVANRYAGFEVDRGLLTNYRIVFDENDDYFKIGEIGSEQIASTRTDDIRDGELVVYKTATKQMSGSGKTLAELQSDYDARYVNVTGDTMTGPLVIDYDSNDTTASLQVNADGDARIRLNNPASGDVYSELAFAQDGTDRWGIYSSALAPESFGIYDYNIGADRLELGLNYTSLNDQAGNKMFYTDGDGGDTSINPGQVDTNIRMYTYNQQAFFLNSNTISSDEYLELGLTPDATSVNDGAFRVNGGASFQKKVYVGSDLTVTNRIFGSGAYIGSTGLESSLSNYYLAIRGSNNTDSTMLIISRSNYGAITLGTGTSQGYGIGMASFDGTNNVDLIMFGRFSTSKTGNYIQLGTGSERSLNANRSQGTDADTAIVNHSDTKDRVVLRVQGQYGTQTQDLLQVGYWNGSARDDKFVVDKDGDITVSSLASISGQYLTTDANGKIVGGGDATGFVTKSGTQADNQIAVFTADGVIEGTSGLTFDGSQILMSNGASGLTAITKNGYIQSTVANTSQTGVNVRSVGDVIPRFQVLGSGKIELGDGSTGYDTNIYRSSANVLKTDDTFEALQLNIAGSSTYVSDISGDLTLTDGNTGSVTLAEIANIVDNGVVNTGTPVNNQVAIWTDATTVEGDADFTWDGTSLILKRSAVTRVQIDNDGTYSSTKSATTGVSQSNKVSGDSENRFQILGDGKMEWGSGSATQDVDLYRDSANILRTSDSLTVDGGLVIDTDTLIVDATNNRVGVGTNSPNSQFDVRGVNTDDDTGLFRIENENSGTGSDTNASFIAKNASGTFQLMQWQNFGARIGSRSIVGTGVGDVVFTHGNDAEKIRITANGLTFNGDTSSANALDDYEEGTFSPVLSFASGSITSTNLGYYTKIGRQVFIYIEIIASAISSPSGLNKITGLPFSQVSATPTFAIHARNLNSTNPELISATGSGTTEIRLWKYSGSGATDSGDMWASNTSFYLSGSYIV